MPIPSVKGGSALKKLSFRNLAVYIAFVALFLVFSITLRNTGAGFADFGNLMNILRQTCLIAIMSVGMVFVLSCALIDLSTGPMVAMSSIIAGILLREYGIAPAIVGAIAFGLLAGGLNGVLIAYLKLPPFIATLGTQTLWMGVARTVTNLKAIPITNKTFTSVFGGGNIGSIPVVFVWMVAIVLIGYLAMFKSPFGRKALAVGGNPRAAYYSGISVERMYLAVMIIMGVLCALAGILWAGRFGGGRYSLGEYSGTSVIAATVLGGTSMMGGIASIFGAVFGAIMIGMIDNALIMYGLNTHQQMIVRGIVIILAVAASTKRSSLK